MKEDVIKFISRATILSLSFLAILITLNQLYIRNVEINKLQNKKEIAWQQFRKGLDNNVLDYAFLGDSHTQRGLNPEYISNSFNFATNGEDYVETYYKIKKILDRDNVQINNFVVQVDAHTFSDKYRTKERLFHDLYYYSKFVPLSEMAKLKEENILSLFIRTNFRVLGEGNEIINDDRTLSFLKPYSKPKEISAPISLGWEKYTDKFTEKNRITNASVKYDNHFSNPPYLTEERSLEYFKKILEIAQQKGINIIIIKYPLSKEYNNEIEKHGISREEYYSTIFSEINKITTDYTILDYYDYFFEKPEYFGDADHLNNIGAKIFSKLVTKDLEGLNSKK